MAPGVGDLAAFEQNVIDRPIGQQPAGRQSGMTGTDDDRGDAFDEAALGLLRRLRRRRSPDW
jgi:hypothetical protein